MNWKQSLLLTAALSVPWLASAAPKKIGEAAAIDKVELKGDAKPGAQVTAIVHVKVDAGYHVQSNKPSEPQYIATVVTVKTPAGVKAGTIQYPEGKSHPLPGLAKPLSVYEGDFTISIPLAIKADATLPLTVKATLGYQACQESSCYAPQKLNFDIDLPAVK